MISSVTYLLTYFTYLLMPSNLLEHISQALSTPLCFASFTSNDVSPSLYHLLAGQHRCVLVCLVFFFLVLVPIASVT